MAESKVFSKRKTHSVRVWRTTSVVAPGRILAWVLTSGASTAGNHVMPDVF